MTILRLAAADLQPQSVPPLVGRVKNNREGEGKEEGEEENAALCFATLLIVASSQPAWLRVATCLKGALV